MLTAHIHTYIYNLKIEMAINRGSGFDFLSPLPATATVCFFLCFSPRSFYQLWICSVRLGPRKCNEGWAILRSYVTLCSLVPTLD